MVRYRVFGFSNEEMKFTLRSREGVMGMVRNRR